ncbi:Exostosin domain-containing protein [Durusdinium trenchii]|uniref:Exostosin domain-containing protein n=1 Tax=Durusdinium trenchii TaxID=1381693 RepID=A0ABP0L731_9DINO
MRLLADVQGVSPAVFGHLGPGALQAVLQQEEVDGLGVWEHGCGAPERVQLGALDVHVPEVVLGGVDLVVGEEPVEGHGVHCGAADVLDVGVLLGVRAELQEGGGLAIVAEVETDGFVERVGDDVVVDVGELVLLPAEAHEVGVCLDPDNVLHGEPESLLVEVSFLALVGAYVEHAGGLDAVLVKDLYHVFSWDEHIFLFVLMLAAVGGAIYGAVYLISEHKNRPPPATFEPAPSALVAGEKLVVGKSFGNMVCTAVFAAACRAFDLEARIDPVFVRDVPYTRLVLTDVETAGFRGAVDRDWMTFSAEKKIANGTWNYNQYVTREQQQQYVSFWEAARPVLRRYFLASFPERSEGALPVVHVRLGDVPMNRHEEYHLAGLQAVEFVARTVGKKAVLVTNAAHMTGPKARAMARRYVAMYVDMFRAAGTAIDLVDDGSQESDLRLMLDAPLLVQLNCSSFSFMAGMAKSRGKFVRAYPFIEGRPFHTDLLPEGSFVPFPPVPHNSVTNYFDFESVKRLVELA